MNKILSNMVTICGVIILGIISVIYSFSTVEISKVMYITVWCVCIGLIRMAAGFAIGMER